MKATQDCLLSAEKTLAYYRDITNCSDHIEFCAVDLVSDLMHFCASHGIDWDNLAKVAKEQVEIEMSEEPIEIEEMNHDN